VIEQIISSRAFSYLAPRRSTRPGAEERLLLGHTTLYPPGLYAPILPMIGIAGCPAPKGLAVAR
jgi:hypothetical protein